MSALVYVSKDRAHTTPIHHLKATKRFAVDEAFSSEGCNTYPPADKIIAQK